MKDVGTSRYSVDNFWLLNHPRHKPLKLWCLALGETLFTALARIKEILNTY